MRIIVVESPYKPTADRSVAPALWLEQLHRNTRYARAAYRYCLLKCGVAPFASHLNYTQPGVLDDLDPEERILGIEAGLVIARKAGDESWFFVDLGGSDGMAQGERHADECGRPKKFIELGPHWAREWLGPTRNRPI